jgi:hypothetical protein
MIEMQIRMPKDWQQANLKLKQWVDHKDDAHKKQKTPK